MRSWPTDEPSPLWRALSREHFASEPLDGPTEADVVVVGGGISGLAAALELRRRGIDTLVLEAATIGAGASGRANGQVIPTLTRHDPQAVVKVYGEERGERFLSLLQASADRLFDAVETHGIDCDARRTGWLQPAHTPGRARAMARRAEQWAARGAPAEAVDAAAMAARLGSAAYHGGWALSSGGHINPLAFTIGLARAASAGGARIHERTPVLRLERSGDGWAVETPKARIQARRIVLASAAHTGELWSGLSRTIVPVTSYQAATEPLGELAARILPGDEAASDTRMDLRYFRKDREGRLVSGGALALQLLAARRMPRLVQRKLAAAYPELAGVRIEHVWGGRIAMTVDRLPHLHRRPDGLVAWLGCNGRGLALSFALGPVLAEACLDVPDGDLALPPQALRSVPFHGFTARTARLILPYYRYRDRREVG